MVTYVADVVWFLLETAYIKVCGLFFFIQVTLFVEILQLNLSNVVFQHFVHYKATAMCFHYIQEKADVSTADVSPKRFGSIESTADRKKTLILGLIHHAIYCKYVSIHYILCHALYDQHC